MLFWAGQGSPDCTGAADTSRCSPQMPWVCGVSTPHSRTASPDGTVPSTADRQSQVSMGRERQPNAEREAILGRRALSQMCRDEEHHDAGLDNVLFLWDFRTVRTLCHAVCFMLRLSGYNNRIHELGNEKPGEAVCFQFADIRSSCWAKLVSA